MLFSPTLCGVMLLFCGTMPMTRIAMLMTVLMMMTLFCDYAVRYWRIRVCELWSLCCSVDNTITCWYLMFLFYIHSLWCWCDGDILMLIPLYSTAVWCRCCCCCWWCHLLFCLLPSVVCYRSLPLSHCWWFCCYWYVTLCDVCDSDVELSFGVVVTVCYDSCCSFIHDLMRGFYFIVLSACLVFTIVVDMVPIAIVVTFTVVLLWCSLFMTGDDIVDGDDIMLLILHSDALWWCDILFYSFLVRWFSCMFIVPVDLWPCLMPFHSWWWYIVIGIRRYWMYCSFMIWWWWYGRWLSCSCYHSIFDMLIVDYILMIFILYTCYDDDVKWYSWYILMMMMMMILLIPSIQYYHYRDYSILYLFWWWWWYILIWWWYILLFIDDELYSLSTLMIECWYDVIHSIRYYVVFWWYIDDDVLNMKWKWYDDMIWYDDIWWYRYTDDILLCDICGIQTIDMHYSIMICYSLLQYWYVLSICYILMKFCIMMIIYWWLWYCDIVVMIPLWWLLLWYDIGMSCSASDVDTIDMIWCIHYVYSVIYDTCCDMILLYDILFILFHCCDKSDTVDTVDDMMMIWWSIMMIWYLFCL